MKNKSGIAETTKHVKREFHELLRLQL